MPKAAYIPPQLFAKVTAKVRELGLWANEAEFIREAVRLRLIQLEAGQAASTGTTTSEA
ncbi:ribbon-helix-helix domain-containing protein [Candidatus Bathyarchaeota archaeon]|nr:ribbon-helix-helix domain-containing protein [Candidatus Bathyarchaeota archaeon]